MFRSISLAIAVAVVEAALIGGVTGALAAPSRALDAPIQVMYGDPAVTGKQWVRTLPVPGSLPTTGLATAPAGPPTGVSAVAGDSEVTVAWTPPADDGGTTISYYAVYAYTPTATSTMSVTANPMSLDVTGLANGNYYVFTVIAYNGLWGSAWSGWSNWARPTSGVSNPVPENTSLLTYYNNSGISDDGAGQMANFDGAGNSYSSQALSNINIITGSMTAFSGETFRWFNGFSGENDNVAAQGQQLTLSSQPSAGRMGFLGAATGGNFSGSLRISYADGSSQTATLTLADWKSGGAAGSQKVATTPYYNCTCAGGMVNTPVGIFFTQVTLDDVAQVTGVTLPGTSGGSTAHVFAVAFGSQTVPAAQLNNLVYATGAVQHNPQVYIVYWGWHGSDPRAVKPYLERMVSGVGGSSWLAVTTQYCSGVAQAASQCGTAGDHVGNPSGIFKASWADDTSPGPGSSPSGAAIEAEAVVAAHHFNLSSTSALENDVIVAMPHGTTLWVNGACAYHSTAPAGGWLPYTALPYIPDYGGTCGGNAVNSGTAGILDGVSIVAGHELAESMTDPDSNGGWLDSAGNENGDKCAYLRTGPGRMQNVTLGTGSFAMQSTWSNAANSGNGACAIS